MSIYSEIKNKLQPAIKKVLIDIGYPDTEVIFSHQNGLEPINTYCIINVLNVEQLGRKDEATFITGEDILESIAPYSLNTQLSFLGQEAEDVSMDFRHAIINNRSAIDTIAKANFGILSRSDLRRIPQKRETEWVKSLNMDIDFSFSVLTRQSYDWVEYIIVNQETIRIWNSN